MRRSASIALVPIQHFGSSSRLTAYFYGAALYVCSFHEHEEESLSLAESGSHRPSARPVGGIKRKVGSREEPDAFVPRGDPENL